MGNSLKHKWRCRTCFIPLHKIRTINKRQFPESGVVDMLYDYRCLEPVGVHSITIFRASSMASANCFGVTLRKEKLTSDRCRCKRSASSGLAFLSVIGLHVSFGNDPLDTTIWNEPHQRDPNVHGAGDPLIKKGGRDCYRIEQQR